MGQLRIRWGWLARGAGVLTGGLVALQVLPGLLAPPEVPPLAADVGLPRVELERAPRIVPEPRPEPSPAPKPAAAREGVSAATALIGTTQRQRKPPPHHKRTPAPALPSVPPPPPESPPLTPAPAPPPAPEDGSLEFAPH